MASLEDLKQERLLKRKALLDRGYSVYKTESKQEITIADLRSSFDSYEEKGDKVWLTGRILAQRGHGNLVFMDIYDGTGTIQLLIKSDLLDPDKYDDLINLSDRGDFIEVFGVASKTKRGEPSLMVEDWAMVTKSLVPLPDSWDGLKDDDLRYRNRHLDLLQNDELRDLFIKKAQFWSEIRDYLETKNFIGVETPTLEVTTGGAEARPFKTFHHDYQMEVFLRISVGELWQKRLMAAGVPRTYEIGRVYRNEGSSPEHLQEFTSCEFYAANMNFADGQDMVIDLFRNLAMKVFNTTKFSTRGHTFDLADDWQQLDYVATVEEMTGINVMESDIAQLKARLQELKVDYQGDNRERLMDSLWKYCRKKISGPAILINHPRLLAPLSNPHPDNPELTLTMQPILAGSEVGRGHSELNNPDLQRERFIKQQELLAGGDEEAMMPDWEYVEMMEHGMPPTFGFGFGERLFSFLIDMSIREATLFPLVKPR